jgi:hypothetical protein
MKYIGNYRDWINPAWQQEALKSRGDGRPLEGQQPNSPAMINEYARVKAAGYRDDVVFFWMFGKHNFSLDVPTPPFITGKFHWWITKMLPGNFMPMHQDPHTVYEKNCNRYWIPLQDWEPGHIFMYENQVVTDYKAGDVWVYNDPTALHGAANIGFTPRIVLQISSYVQ